MKLIKNDKLECQIADVADMFLDRREFFPVAGEATYYIIP